MHRLRQVQVPAAVIARLQEVAQVRGLQAVEKRTSDAARLAFAIQSVAAASGSFQDAIQHIQKGQDPLVADSIIDGKYSFECVLRLEYMFPDIAYRHEVTAVSDAAAAEAEADAAAAAGDDGGGGGDDIDYGNE